MKSFEKTETPLNSLLPGLYVVATPIGNIRDITLRGLDVLRAADIILSEDTRRTGKLLESFSIDSQLSPYHDQNAAKRVPGVIKDLQAGKRMALVSDAGTPLVSDPGYKLVSAVIAAGLDVFPVPGASSLLAGLVKSGLPSDAVFFAGFLPAKSAARITALKTMKTIPGTLVFFETGQRIRESIRDMIDVLGDRRAALTRELTKTYEAARYGSLSEILQSIELHPPRGEIVLLIDRVTAVQRWSETEIDAGLDRLRPDMGVKAAANILAQESGWPKREIYNYAVKREQ